MALLPIKFPPGVYRSGTQYQSKGRWYDTNLVRFYQGTIQPEGGWRKKTSSTVTGKGRAIITWRDNSAQTWAAVGTESHLYAMNRSGSLFDITPVGFTSGRADAVSAGGYGSGLYGTGLYGVPRPDSTTVLEASMWSQDTFGQNYVGVMAEDGKIYQWTLNTGTPAAAVSGAPTASSLFVTNEGMLVALAAAGDPRSVAWSDQRNNTVWTPSATNQAGDFELQTNGQLLQGLRIKGTHLLLTDLDAHSMSYTADTLVYSFVRVGDGCGAISRGCAIGLDGQAVWMGKNGFWLYNGYVQPLPCDVWDYVFSNLNTLQVSKITVEMNAAFGEIRWNYPSASSTEIDSYVKWNFRENHWTIGSVPRLSGVDQGVTLYPLRVANDGYVYEHEVGNSYGGIVPHLESGPIEIGNGDQVQYATLLMPDDATVGDVNATFYVKFEPDDTEASFGPYSIAKRTNVRFCGRQMRVRFDGVQLDSWRIGEPRLNLIGGGLR